MKQIFLQLQKSFYELFVPPKKQIPALDGIRTLAILLVVGLHSNVHMMWAGLDRAIFARILPFQGGWVGVPLFFILSGFFIGKQLWSEFLKTGTIAIRSFILRRGLRIWPLYYFVCFTVLLVFPEKCENIWSNLLFFANYYGDVGPVRGAWSLSTEEQFYIFIPILIFSLAKYFRFKSLADYRKLLIFSLFLPMISRAITWYFLTGFEFFDITLYRLKIYRPIHTHFDGLVVGLLISNILVDKSFKIPRFLQFPINFLGIVLVFALPLSFLQKVVFNYAALAALFGAFVWMALRSENFITRFLSLRIFYWTAKVSFGVYLIHHPVLWTMERFGWFHSIIINAEIHLLLTYFLTFFIAALVSSITYILIEAPFIHWRNQWLRSKAPS